jgi:PAS domain S-box-containing protein
MPEDDESPQVAALQQRITDLEKSLAQLQIQATLPESEERYRVLLENMNEGVMYVNTGQVIQFVNGRFCELVGYTREELVGSNAFDLFITQTDHSAMSTRMQRRQQGVTDKYEMQIKGKSGELIWVQISGAPYYDSRGNLIGMLGVHTDITARKTVETHLRQTEHLFQTIVNSIEEGVIVYDIDLRYLLWNRFMEILTDMPATEVIGKQATELFPHLQEQGIVNLLEHALAGETILSNDTPYRIPHTNKTGWYRCQPAPSQCASCASIR